MSCGFSLTTVSWENILTSCYLYGEDVRSIVRENNIKCQCFQISGIKGKTIDCVAGAMPFIATMT